MLDKLLEILKLTPKYLLGLAIATGVLLFSSIDIIGKFGLTDFVGNYRDIIGSVFLLCISVLICEFIWKIIIYTKGKIELFSINKFRKSRLKNLTIREKEILSYYIFNQVRSQILDYNDGSVTDLEMHQVIYRASQISVRHTMFSYNIQPWAWEYLNKNKHLIHVGIENVL